MEHPQSMVLHSYLLHGPRQCYHYSLIVIKERPGNIIVAKCDHNLHNDIFSWNAVMNFIKRKYLHTSAKIIFLNNSVRQGADADEV